MSKLYRPAELLIEVARSKLFRLEPNHAAFAMRMGALLVDIRYKEQREPDGDIPGAIHVNTNEVEWRCDPDSDFRHPLIDHGSFLILICNQGYKSSLVAADLIDMGLSHKVITDVVGGFEAWKASDLPIIPYSPDH